jgi:P27 family predicted phage terminase small subunit
VANPKGRPKLAVVRAGNPGHQSKAKLDPGLVLAADPPAEPDWGRWFPPVPDESERSADATAARELARAEWLAIVPVLAAQGILSQVDGTVLADHCVVAARIALCEQDITRHGVWVEGERGAQKNPSTTAANQYRTQLRHTMSVLGLTPHARQLLKGGKDDEAESAWD